MQMAKRCEGQKDVNGKKLPLFKTRQNEKKGGAILFTKLKNLTGHRIFRSPYT